jgi:hypothetical protein
MPRFHLYTLLLILSLASQALADSNACGEFAERDCQQRPCPCQAGEITLKVMPDPRTGHSICACGKQSDSPLSLRRKAAERCHRHQVEQHESCFVSRGGCPLGFEAIASFTSPVGEGFSACKDLRHNHAKAEHSAQSKRLQQNPSEIMQQYNGLIELLKRKGEGGSQPLPDHSIERLYRHFGGISLRTLRFTHTKALSQGCFSDCQQIYCADRQTVDQWTRREAPIIDQQLLHQIAHAERCQLQGGRDRFVSLWFRYLPAETQEELNKGEAIDADNIHFAMFMEQHAEHRAESICRRLADCSRGNP